MARKKLKNISGRGKFGRGKGCGKIEARKKFCEVRVMYLGNSTIMSIIFAIARITDIFIFAFSGWVYLKEMKSKGVIEEEVGRFLLSFSQN